MNESLGEALPAEIKRVQDLIPLYAECGPVASIALALMQASLDRAVEALASGDVVAMLQAFEDLKGYNA